MNSIAGMFFLSDFSQSTTLFALLCETNSQPLHTSLDSFRQWFGWNRKELLSIDDQTQSFLLVECARKMFSFHFRTDHSTVGRFAFDKAIYCHGKTTALVALTMMMLTTADVSSLN